MSFHQTVMETIPAPTVHLNGNSREDLIQQTQTVVKLLKELESAMAAAMPHERNYYVQEDGTLKYLQAREVFCQDRAALSEMLTRHRELYYAVKYPEA